MMPSSRTYFRVMCVGWLIASVLLVIVSAYSWVNTSVSHTYEVLHASEEWLSDGAGQVRAAWIQEQFVTSLYGAAIGLVNAIVLGWALVVTRPEKGAA